MNGKLWTERLPCQADTRQAQDFPVGARPDAEVADSNDRQLPETRIAAADRIQPSWKIRNC